MWVVFTYASTSLFSLKISSATSSGGKSLLVPTPYAAKMAFVNAAFRAGRPDGACERLCRELRDVAVRVGVPEGIVVTQTFIKVRQENRDARHNPTEPYKSTIAYRELVHLRGSLRVAFEASEDLGQQLESLAPVVNCFGKRGSFFQYSGVARAADLGPGFTQPIQDERPWECPPRAHIVPTDDFGPQAELSVLSSFTDAKAKRDKHRRFVPTIVPLGITNVGPGFAEYTRN
jgi:hypothetical protein